MRDGREMDFYTTATLTQCHKIDLMEGESPDEPFVAKIGPAGASSSTCYAIQSQFLPLLPRRG